MERGGDGGVREEDREREGDEEQDAMTSSSAGVAWRIGYVGVSTLCVMMILWIWFAPGSCSPISRAMDDARFRRASEALVPANLVLKYRDHLAVCVAHVLPASAWCAIAPFQIHPSARKRFPRAHRIAGRVFFALSASSSCFFATSFTFIRFAAAYQ